MRAAQPPESERDARMTQAISHLDLLEAESIHIFREAAAQFRKPVLLYSIGKDSTVLLHLARKAFWPGKLPFPTLHIDTGWKFREMIEFRDKTARDFDLDLIVHTNEDGRAKGINPIDYAPSVYTDVMKTVPLKQALDKYAFDAAFGGARRDEEASRAKERVFSFRAEGHRWDPRRQRPEMWRLLNGHSPVARKTRMLSSLNPGDDTISTSTDQFSAASPASSCSSRAAVRTGSSPSTSSRPAGSSQSRRPTGCRYWYTIATRSRSSSATTATAPKCSTTSRRATTPPGICTSSTRSARIFPA